MEKQNAQEDTLTGQTIQPKRAKQKEEKLANGFKLNGSLTFLHAGLRTQLWDCNFADFRFLFDW